MFDQNQRVKTSDFPLSEISAIFSFSVEIQGLMYTHSLVQRQVQFFSALALTFQQQLITGRALFSQNDSVNRCNNFNE